MEETKFIKKPEIIEAFQMTKERRQDNSSWPDWLHLAWNKAHNEIGALYPMDFPDSDGKDHLLLVTDDGVYKIEWKDYIVRNQLGELSAMDPEVLDAFYQKI